MKPEFIAIEKTKFGYAGLTKDQEIYLMGWIGDPKTHKLDSYSANKVRYYFKNYGK